LVGLRAESTDRGVSWSRLSSGQTEDLHEVSCADAATCFASGANGQVLKTIDGGTQWNVMAQPSTGTLGALSCPTPDVCYVDAGTGKLMKTLDGGASWTLARDFAADARTDYQLSDIECFDPPTCVVLLRAQRGNIPAT
jgi:photosystem II stability/assembly factor-like uncharacterized protein